ncbi:hypothetical protein [Streptomyces sp. NPDC046821]|uniref:hypothetical protein n=1 Tax=Streptomyces sp. NPDC046821 TaxID=3154702 RepID=UPI0033E039AA
MGRPLVDRHSVLMPGEKVPTSDDPGVTYTERDVSDETAVLQQRRTAANILCGCL